MRTQDWAGAAVENLRIGSGFTAHPESGLYSGPGFGVSPYPERSRSLFLADGALGASLETVLHTFELENEDLLSRPNHYVGGWLRSPRELVLDVSIVTSSRRTASTLRDRHHQLAYHRFDRV